MSTKWMLVGALVLTMGFVAPVAYADKGFDLGKALKHVGGGNGNFPVLKQLGKHQSKGDFPILKGIAKMHGNGGNWGSNRRGGNWGGNWGGGRGFGNYGYDRHSYDYPEAIRDAAIAGALGNVVTSLVTPRGYGYSGAAYGVAPVAPVYAQPMYAQPMVAQPSGHYETRRVLVSEGRTEVYPEWVPEHIDAKGRHVNGFYETRQRFVPDVYEEQRVWVSP